MKLEKNKVFFLGEACLGTLAVLRCLYYGHPILALQNNHTSHNLSVCLPLLDSEPLRGRGRSFVSSAASSVLRIVPGT